MKRTLIFSYTIAIAATTGTFILLAMLQGSSTTSFMLIVAVADQVFIYGDNQLHNRTLGMGSAALHGALEEPTPQVQNPRRSLAVIRRLQCEELAFLSA